MVLLISAAGQRDADADDAMARLFLDGELLDQDPVKAFGLAFRTGRPDSLVMAADAAELLTPEHVGQAMDAVMNEYGKGRYAIAVKGAEILAHRGIASAQYHLGLMTALGYGTGQNLIEAMKWIGLSGAYDAPGKAELRHRLREELSEAELDTIREQVVRWEPARWKPETESEMLTAGDGGVTNPRLVNRVNPEYPESARLRSLRGNVVLQAVITKTGAVADLRVIRSDRPGFGFEEAAMTAVGQWKYQPARLDGRPVDVYFTIFVEFRLR